MHVRGQEVEGDLAKVTKLLGRAPYSGGNPCPTLHQKAPEARTATTARRTTTQLPPVSRVSRIRSSRSPMLRDEQCIASELPCACSFPRGGAGKQGSLPPPPHLPCLVNYTRAAKQLWHAAQAGTKMTSSRCFSLSVQLPATRESMDKREPIRDERCYMLHKPLLVSSPSFSLASFPVKVGLTLGRGTSCTCTAHLHQTW